MGSVDNGQLWLFRLEDPERAVRNSSRILGRKGKKLKLDDTVQSKKNEMGPVLLKGMEAQAMLGIYGVLMHTGSM